MEFTVSHSYAVTISIMMYINAVKAHPKGGEGSVLRVFSVGGCKGSSVRFSPVSSRNNFPNSNAVKIVFRLFKSSVQ